MRKETYFDAIAGITTDICPSNFNVNLVTNRTSGQPILIINYPDDSIRAYDIPYSPSLLILADNGLYDVPELTNLFSNIREDINDYNNIREDISNYNEINEPSVTEQINETSNAIYSLDYYEDYDTDSLDEFEQTTRKYIEDYADDVNSELVNYIALNNEYQTNNKSFLETMESSLRTYTRVYTEDYYEDYDTDYADAFEDMTKQYIKDNRHIFVNPIETFIDTLDYEMLNSIYQDNDLSFRDTLLNEFEGMDLLRVDYDNLRLEEEYEDDEYDDEYEDEYEEDEDFFEGPEWDDIKDKIFIIAHPESFENYDIYIPNKDLVKDLDIKISYGFKDSEGRIVNITKDMIADWGITRKEFRNQAKKNMYNNVVVRDIAIMFGGSPSNCYSITNGMSSFGAGNIAILDKVCDNIIHSSLIVIPSSTSELILIPTNNYPNSEYINELNDLINQVNMTLNNSTDGAILGTHAYFYDKDEQEIIPLETRTRDQDLEEDDLPFN